MLTSSRIKHRFSRHLRCRAALVAGVGLAISLLRNDPGRMPAALWQLTARCTSVEMFSAWAQEAHRIKEGEASGGWGGKTTSKAGSTISCTMAVLPDPPWPTNIRCRVCLCSSGTSSRSSSHAELHASAKSARKRV